MQHVSCLIWIRLPKLSLDGRATAVDTISILEIQLLVANKVHSSRIHKIGVTIGQ